MDSQGSQVRSLPRSSSSADCSINPSNNALPEPEKRNGVVENDSECLLRLMREIQTLARKDDEQLRAGTDIGVLAPEDRAFIQNARRKVSMFGLAGGMIGGGFAMFMLRKSNNNVVRLPTVVLCWLVGSGVGRFAGVDASLGDMISLPPPSVLARTARRVVKECAERDGYFVKRFGLKAGPGEELCDATGDGNEFDGNRGSNTIGDPSEVSTPLARQQQAAIDPLLPYRRTFSQDPHLLSPLNSSSEKSSFEKNSSSSSNSNHDDFYSQDSFDGTSDLISQGSLYDDFDDSFVPSQPDSRQKAQQQPRPQIARGGQSIYDDDFDDRRFDNTPKKSWEEIRAEYQRKY